MRGLKFGLTVAAAVIGAAATAPAQDAKRAHLEKEEARRAEVLRLLAKVGTKPSTGRILQTGATKPDVVKRYEPEPPGALPTPIPVSYTETTQERPAAPKQAPKDEPPRPIVRPGEQTQPPAKTAQPPDRTITPPLSSGDGKIGDAPRDISRSRIEFLGPDSVILSAPPEQMEAIARLLEELDRAGSLAEADMEQVPLKNAEAAQLARLMTAIYTAKGEVRTQTGGQTQTAGTQQGKVAFIPVAQPNSVVIVARKADIPDIAAHVRELDNRSREGEQFKVFGLKLAPAGYVATKLSAFFADRAAQQQAAATGAAQAQLRVRVEVIADERTNSLFVYAGPSDMAQAELLIERFDRGEIPAEAVLKYFILKNATATEMQQLLQNSILRRAQAAGQTTTTAPGQPQPGQQQPGALPFNQQNQQQATSTAATGGVKSAKIRLMAKDNTGAFIESGILEDITIATDPRANALLVTAPKESMGLIEELIRQIDGVPNPPAELKVFELKNADATAMLQTLQAFFGQDAGGGAFNQNQFGGNQFNQGFNAGGQTGAQPRSFTVGGATPQLSLTPLTFSVDQRTNSLLVAGSTNDMIAVETLIFRLDGNNARERKNFVYRLNNVPAEDAEVTIQNFLQGQATGALGAAVSAATQGTLTLQQQIAQDVVIVADLTTNSLIISASPRYFEEVLKMIQILDRRPPQVVIQCLIAEVTLQQNDEFGVELGFQGTNLFARSIVATNELVPGVNFNTTGPLRSPTTGNFRSVGFQGVSNLSLGRSGSQGFGGLIFSASSQNVSVLLRALSRQQRLDVLSRPQLMTLDNRESRMLIGQEVPYVVGSNISALGNTQLLTDQREVGVILVVQPQIGPDGVIVMRVNPQVSSIDQTASIPISVDASGNVVATSPIFNVTNVDTTVVAADGQTVIVAGLISRQRSQDVRKVPWVGDIPLIGHLFRVDFSECIKRELIIILTPRIVYCDEDVERVKAEETARLDWCMPDVFKVHGDPYAPAYPSVEGGDRCVDALGQEIPPNLKLPPQGRPRARAALDAQRGDGACCEGQQATPGGAMPIAPPFDPTMQGLPTPPPVYDNPNAAPPPQQPIAPGARVPAPGVPLSKNGVAPSNLKMLPSVAPKGTTIPAAQTAASADALVLPPDGAKGARRVIVGGPPSRLPSAPPVQNQIYRSVRTPEQNMQR